MSRVTLLTRFNISIKYTTTIIRGVYLLRKFRRSRRNVIQSSLDEDDIRDKVVIVTGGSSGMGKASAKEFAKRGAIVVIGDVDLKNGEITVEEIKIETGNPNVKIMKLDLSDLDAVEDFAKKISMDYPKIKILLNNAGIGSVVKQRVITKDGFNLHIGINYMGHFLLTNLLLDNLKAEEKARVVSMTSTMQIFYNFDLDDLNMEKPGIGFDLGLPYANSKFCLSLFTKELGKRMDGLGITTYALCPTIVNTDLSTETIPKPLLGAFRRFHGFIGITPEVAASEFIMHCALEKSVENETGNIYRFRKHCDELSKTLDDELACHLWEKSSKLVRLQERLERMPSQI